MTDKSFAVTLRFLPPGEFQMRCKDKGLSEAILKKEKALFNQWISLECTVVNEGAEAIFLNPLHIQIVDNNRPVGNLLEPGFFSIKKDKPESGLQAFSGLFDKSGIEVPAGETRRRVLTFQPLGGSFPLRTLDFIIYHFYVGMEDYRLKGQITLKSCSTK